jgi:hypothetical protein
LKGSHGAIFYFAGCTHSGWCPKWRQRKTSKLLSTNLFCTWKVGEFVKNSKELVLLSNHCIPSNCSSNEQKQAIDGLFKLILHRHDGLREHMMCTAIWKPKSW